jgi:hypothetical protein
LTNRPWDQELADRAWRGTARPSGAQSWENLEVDGFHRSGDFERWKEQADAALDEAIGRTLRRVTSLDREVRALCVHLARLEESEVLQAIAQGLAVSAWDEARRLSGMGELAVVGRARNRKFPFASLAEFLDRASCSTILGGGSMSLAVAEDRNEDLAERRRLRSAGVEFLPVSPTRSGGREPRGVDAIHLELTCDAAIRAANVGEIHERALDWLRAFHVGTWVRVPKRAALGEEKRNQHELVRQTVPTIASAAGVSDRVVREVLRRARARLFDVLVQRELIAPIERKRRPLTEERPALVADW